MSRPHLRSLAVLAVCLLALAAVPAVAAVPAADACTAPQIEGTWIVEVTLAGPPPGFPPSFTALETYSRGCGMVTSNALPPVPRPGQGTWESLNGRRFSVGIHFFTFDATGAPSGTAVITHTVRVDDADRYVGRGEAEFFDADGNSLAVVRFTSVGVRL